MRRLASSASSSASPRARTCSSCRVRRQRPSARRTCSSSAGEATSAVSGDRSEVGGGRAGEARKFGAEGGELEVEALAFTGEFTAAGGHRFDAADQAFDGGGLGEQGVVDGVLGDATLEALELVGEGLMALLAGPELDEQGSHTLGVGRVQRGGELRVGEASEQALMGVEVLECGEERVDSGAAETEAGELGVGACERVASVLERLGEGEVLRLLEGCLAQGVAGVADGAEVAVDRWVLAAGLEQRIGLVAEVTEHAAHGLGTAAERAAAEELAKAGDLQELGTLLEVGVGEAEDGAVEVGGDAAEVAGEARLVEGDLAGLAAQVAEQGVFSLLATDELEALAGAVLTRVAWIAIAW
jgi:hypothetical protein